MFQIISKQNSDIQSTREIYRLAKNYFHYMSLLLSNKSNNNVSTFDCDLRSTITVHSKVYITNQNDN